MARLVSWNYHQEDWNGKNGGYLDWMRFYNASGQLVMDTGWQDINGRNNYASGNIGGNFDNINHMAMRWVRDTSSNGGGYWRVWVTDDLGQKYLVLVSRQCRTGKNYEYNEINLGGGWDSGWAGYASNWRLRRVQIYNTNGCVSVCNCRDGNCSCRGNHPCECQSGRCGSYGCSCHNRCSNNCPDNNSYGCSCNSQKVPAICSADCTSHSCNCNSNLRFSTNSIIYSSDIARLADDIRNAGAYVGTQVTTAMQSSGLIEATHIKNMNNALKQVYNKVKSLNYNFNYDYNDIDSCMPTTNDGYIKLETYKKMSDLSLQIQTLCKAHDACPNNCPAFSTCGANCICNHNNQGNWVTEGWACPCNSQCSCNGQCSGVCSNCACNAQDIMDSCYIV